MMNFFDKLAVAAAIACVVVSAVDRDYTEMMAWIIIVLLNVVDLTKSK